MNNLIKSQWFLFKKNSNLIIIFIIISYLVIFLGGPVGDKGFMPFGVQALSTGSIFAIGIIVLLISTFLGGCYQKRMLLYEIMAGFTPGKIIFSRVALYVPFVTVFFLIPSSAVFLIFDHSTEMIRTLICFWIFFLRFLLSTIFLSPLLKEETYATVFFLFVLMAKSFYIQAFGSSQQFLNSFFGLTVFGQCSCLGNPLPSGFLIKVIISAIVFCLIYYLIGYFTLRKKHKLEPRTII